MRLSLKPSVVVSPCDDGALAYDIESGQLHRLNPLAALIVELTSAQRSQEDILAEVAPLLGESSAVGCEAWIAQAIAEGLLIDATVATAPPSADELRRISTELRRTDHVLAAFLCQQQAVEIDSSDPQQWYRLGELAHIVGRRVEARAAYEEYQRACPQDAEVEHLLLALRDALPPPRASNTCIEHIYSYFASFYDRNMCEELEYQAPKFLWEALAMALSGRKDLIALDAGCGTGLFGLAIKPATQCLVGVDLSEAMIDQARQRGIYDSLEKAELTEWFGRDPARQYDVIGLCDTLIYFGDLGQVLPAAFKHLKPGGMLGFTVEKGEVSPFIFTDSGRFAHHQNHLLAVVDAAGYRVVTQAEEVLRFEYGEAVHGWVTVVQRPSDKSVV